ncbi:MAG: hypothetical protein QOG98_3781, partial [Pseudonocardiales bacterium]|nr:hypothetical protein [Pseudonocardiales bacterium]
MTGEEPTYRVSVEFLVLCPHLC